MGELHNAVKANDYERVEELLADGADPNEENEDGFTPIELAQSEDIEDELLMYGAHRSDDYYSEMRYYATYEGVFGFDEALRDELLLKLKAHYNTQLQDSSEEELENTDDEFKRALVVIGISSIRAGIPVYTTNYGSTYELNELFELCGFDVSYEGSNNPVEGKTGVYFIE